MSQQATRCARMPLDPTRSAQPPVHGQGGSPGEGRKPRPNSSRSTSEIIVGRDERSAAALLLCSGAAAGGRSASAAAAAAVCQATA